MAIGPLVLVASAEAPIRLLLEVAAALVVVLGVEELAAVSGGGVAEVEGSSNN